MASTIALFCRPGDTIHRVIRGPEPTPEPEVLGTVRACAVRTDPESGRKHVRFDFARGPVELPAESIVECRWHGTTAGRVWRMMD